MGTARVLVPAHLRQYIVEQDYEQYTEMDHAVWRFVLLQTHAHLKGTAHPAYESGLSATGIGVERIPRIDEMNEKLSRFGWGAVCVDGFIPPRAFQGFQANRILPIAAEIRTAEHLAYTPAPDIIHEAAGHAPILSEPEYAAFIQEIGATAEKAFTNPADRAVFDAIHALSELKENPGTTEEQVAIAQRVLGRALGNVTEVSESARMARLYWWTAEYGLIGTPGDYRLYGAGLLSSLGESRSCHDSSVRKIPLSSGCIEFDYDITQAQPHLFVARSFEHLREVLSEVSATLACRVGGAEALQTALKSDELGTLTFESGIDVIGTLSGVEPSKGTPCVVQLKGAVALARSGALLEGIRCPNEYVVPFGRLRGGGSPAALSVEEIERRAAPERFQLEFESGVRVTGMLRGVRAIDEHIRIILLERFELTLPSQRVFRSQSLYPLILAHHLPKVRAGAPPTYFGTSAPSLARVPRPRWLSPRDLRLVRLYEEAMEAWRALAGGALVATFERIHGELEREYPDDWLLRWNLLESLTKIAQSGPLSSQISAKLELLEAQYLHRVPIASGLASIRAMGQASGEGAIGSRN